MLAPLIHVGDVITGRIIVNIARNAPITETTGYSKVGQCKFKMISELYAKTKITCI
jgi:hypothetical protein